MKINRYILMLILGSSLYACKDDYLDVRKIDANISTSQLYSTYTYVQGVVWNTYSYLPDGFEELQREAATDNAESTNVSSMSQVFNMGIWNQFLNPDAVWSKNFQGIRQANLFLKNKHKIDISHLKNGIVGVDSSSYFNARDNVKYMEGEVLFLKSYFYFELVKRYGAVPIFEEPLDYNNRDTWKNAPRNSVDEVLKYIVSLCDQAANIIPANLSASWYEEGRVTHGAIKALKAKVMLYGASPLYKDAGSSITWAAAAKAAYDVISLNKYTLDPSYSRLFGPNNNETTELIFSRKYGAINTVERNNFPIVFENSNGNSVTPSQNFVDNFEVVTKDGSGNIVSSVPFDWNNPVHKEHPYENRDPRFAATVIFNNSIYKSTVIQTFNGGNSGLPILNATKTGYYLSKWSNSALDLVNNTTSNHNWSYIRYADILLSYAEAMYNANGAEGNPEGYSLTALKAINLVRNRASLPALTAAQLNQAAIERERNVELGFEDQRFWDVRRWKKGENYFKAPLNRIVITKETPEAIGFKYNFTKLEDRVYDKKMDWYPISQAEINITGWAQNPGW